MSTMYVRLQEPGWDYAPKADEVVNEMVALTWEDVWSENARLEQFAHSTQQAPGRR